jgi:hypothetical protein
MRIRRKFRVPRGTNLLTDAQRDVLLFGYSFAAGNKWVRNDGQPGEIIKGGALPFKDSTSAERAWRQHRQELMREELGPGHRPAWFYRIDLGITPPCNWAQELAILDTQHLLTPEEALAVERQHAQLNPADSGTFSAFEDAESLRRQRLSTAVLRRAAEEFEFASLWHQARGRPELASRFALRAAITNSVMSEMRGGADEAA